MVELLRADLSGVRLASLLQLAEGEMLTGELLVPGGRLGLRDGEVVQATWGTLGGYDAVRQAFLVTSGTAVAAKGDAPAGAPIAPVLSLVMEGCRVADEWDRVAPMVLTATDPSTLDGLPVRIARRLDGRSPVFEVVQDAGALPVEVLDELLRLLDEGLLRSAGPPRVDAFRAASSPVPAAVAAPPPAPTTTPARSATPAPVPTAEAPDYWADLERGREHLRAGELERAEHSFRRALEARPGDRIATQNLRRAQALRTAEATS